MRFSILIAQSILWSLNISITFIREDSNCPGWAGPAASLLLALEAASTGLARAEKNREVEQVKSLINKSNTVLALLLTAIMLFTGLTGCVVTEKPAAAATNPIMAEETIITSIYEQASPAIVEIVVTSKSTVFSGYSTSGQGSGFLIDNEGHILTNYHVVDSTTRVEVIFNNGNSATATILGTDEASDLAVIKVDAAAVAGITPLTLTDSSYLKPGQIAIALGSPYGLVNSISVGVISGLNRQVEGSSLPGMIQTDANIQPGNSGGPLLNSSGLVVGINTAFEGQGTGIGYAIPSSVALRVLPELKAGKTIERPWLGFSVLELTESLAKEIGITYHQGVYIVEIVTDSPAAKAKLVASGSYANGMPKKGGDIITAIDGQAVKRFIDLQNYLVTRKVGDTVTLNILRENINLGVSLTLVARPKSTTSTPQIPSIPWPWGQRD